MNSRLELSARSSVREGQIEGFKATALEFIKQTAERDTGTLRFDWYLSVDERESELREEYQGPQAFVEHKMHTSEITETLFAKYAADHQVALFGDPPPELVEKVESTPMGKTVTWFRYFQGLGADSVSFWSGESSGPKPGLELGAHMTLRAGQETGFREQAAEMLRLTRELDTRTLRYDWFISRDGTRCDVREAYIDGQGLVEHNAHIAQARDRLFEQFADNHFMTAYAEVMPDLRGLVHDTHMEEHFKFYKLLGGLPAKAAAQPATLG